LLVVRVKVDTVNAASKAENELTVSVLSTNRSVLTVDTVIAPKYPEPLEIAFALICETLAIPA
jgi:hypothetical protein